MQDINGVVLGVSSKSGTGKNGKPYTKFEIQYSDGKPWATFDAGLATKASQLQGQPSSLRGNVVQRGQFTNYDLVDIASEGQLPPMTEEQQSIPTVQNIPQNNYGGNVSNDKDVQIRRAVALKAAVDLVIADKVSIGHLSDKFGELENLLQNGVPTPTPEPTDSMNQEELAATVPNTQVGSWNES